MEDLNLHVLRTLLDWRQAGRASLIATVTRTWGSSPRPVGSIMALCEGGAVVGSVSGGCIEDDLIHRFRGASFDSPPQRKQYGVSADEANRFGLPCGGTIELLLEFNPCVAELSELVARLGNGQLVLRRTHIESGSVSLVDAKVPTELCEADGWVQNMLGPQYRLLLIGAGQPTEYLATMALFSGFSVTVCDPREEHSGGCPIQGVILTRAMPDDVVREFQADRRTAIVALTHDPKLDDLALLEALETPAFYVGAIGSRRNQHARKTRLIEHFQLNAENLLRLKGPIGIYVGSKTPAEIAISVMAELVAVKNGVQLPPQMQVEHAKKGAPETGAHQQPF